MESIWDLVALGEALVEFNQTQPGQPHYLQGFGGDTSNSCIAAARAGARVAYLSRLGEDTFGDELLRLWANEGVDASAVERDTQQPTGLYFVTHGPQGHSFSYLRKGSAASCMTPKWLHRHAAELLKRSKLLLVSGISLAISPQAFDTAVQAMNFVRAAGGRVAFDPNLRLKLWPLERAKASISHAVGLCDVFLPGVDDMQALMGLSEPNDIADWGHARGASLVVVKMGKDGVLFSDLAAGRHRVPGRVVKAVDATGAGDSFNGNFLARLALGDAPLAAVRYANTAASLAVQGYGAVAPLPTRAQVQAAMYV
ncbi:2-dehydro-3-deoxygluconokinase [Curvibacter sp. AEP1-3]|uniref:sugar kinase n=1 Tax=Curvibacter sp. AEP1-3 TaxID=1844971 RepID=UPI000B3C73B6|nr:sugar kinase [Curvibacter sp. AEP1-3]ARV19921.1 2-dehydro-3-deoxygluconokinase [Curvibacter sp. AEP1-3]